MRSLILCLLLMISVTFSCEPVGTPTEGGKGELTKMDLQNVSGIPSQFGTLAAVTTDAHYPNWAQLWFVDNENTIRMVRIQFLDNKMHEKVLVIPRH